jgi:hydroxymethylglutaryl-CoA reductase (NADPH)
MVRGSSLLPKQLRSLGSSDSWLNRTVTSNLLPISQLACQHPIHTIVAIALLASTSYVGLLQESLFDSGIKSLQHNGQVDIDSLLKGSRTLELSKNTAWKWQISDDSIPETSLVRPLIT